MIGANKLNRNVRDSIDSRVLPTLKTKAVALEQYAATLGIVFGYPDYSGFRSQADTTKLIQWRDQAVRVGGSAAYYPVAPYGVGYHPYGSAFDIDVVAWPKDKTEAWAYAQLGAYAPRIGLTWGGTFSGKQKDVFHFQLNITLDTAKTLFAVYAKTLGPSMPLSSTPPKQGSAILTKAVALASTQTGAISLGIVAMLALVTVGFFLIAPAVVEVGRCFNAP